MNAPGPATIAYERERHYLFCDHCGAPVHFAPHSPRASCGHCQAPLELRMRPEAAASPPRARNEDERILILHGQDRRFWPPRELIHLFVAERVAPAREGEAYAHFHALRAAANDESALERLFALALALGEHAIERGDGVSQRALLDSLLQASGSARHHQVMRAQLARGALRAGLHDAAEAWLAACDPRSEDLIGDTAYRFARAYVDSARGDWAAVVRTLHAGELPLSDIYAPECAVLCANAWEKLGQRATAVDVLVSAKRTLGPIARRRIRRFIDAHPGWQACAIAEPEAERRVAGMDDLPAEGGAIAALLLGVMAVYSLLWGASAILAIAALAYYEIDTGFGDWSASLFGGGTMGLVLFPIALIAAKSARNQRLKRTRFTPCAAHVIDLRQLASDEVSSESALVRLELLIVPDDLPAYFATLESSVQRVMLQNFAPGKLLIALVNPRDPRDFVLEVM